MAFESAHWRHPQVEVLTKWGVLSGKLIFSRVLTLTTMGSVYVIRAQQARLEQNSRVWRRIEGRARRVVTAAASLSARVVQEKGDMYHADWRTNEGGALSELFTSESGPKLTGSCFLLSFWKTDWDTRQTHHLLMISGWDTLDIYFTLFHKVGPPEGNCWNDVHVAKLAPSNLTRVAKILKATTTGASTFWFRKKIMINYGLWTLCTQPISRTDPHQFFLLDFTCSFGSWPTPPIPKSRRWWTFKKHLVPFSDVRDLVGI